MTDLPQHPMQDGQLLDANLHLLDRSVLDTDRTPTSVIDDVELDLREGARPIIASLVLGSSIVSRFFGGHPPDHRRYRVPWTAVGSVESAVILSVPRSEVDVVWFEGWLREHVIGRIPGGRHDPE